MIGDDKRKAALDALRTYADELRTEIEHQAAKLKRRLAAVEQSISALAGDEAEAVGQQGTRPTTGIRAKYAGVGPQAAVERFLKEHPGHFFLPSEMSAQLKAQGFSVTNPKLATQQVSIALSRAAGKGVAVIDRRHGKKVYTFKAEGQQDEDDK